MSVLHNAKGFITKGKMKMINDSQVQYVDMNITTKGFELVGATFELFDFHKDSTGYRVDVSWADIKHINRTKEKLMHVIVIGTSNGFYTFMPMQPQSMSPMGISSTKRHTKDLLNAINKAKAKIQIANPEVIFCIACGEQLEPDSEFCGNCGKKII